MSSRSVSIYYMSSCFCLVFVFLMVRAQPGSHPLYSSEASDVYKRKDLKGEPRKSCVELGSFKVPAFHASLISQKTGSIFISGGNIDMA